MIAGEDSAMAGRCVSVPPYKSAFSAGRLVRCFTSHDDAAMAFEFPHDVRFADTDAVSHIFTHADLGGGL